MERECEVRSSFGWRVGDGEARWPPARHSSEGSPAPLSSHILVTYVHLHRSALPVESTQVAGQGLEHCVHVLHVQALSFQILGTEKFDWI